MAERQALSPKYGSLPFAQAIAHYRQKLNIPTATWRDVWAEAHNRSFMVAGAMGNDLLNDLRGAVDDAIARGVSLSEFQKQFASIAAKHGWDYTGNEAWRARIIYDTNMRQSYNAGREAQIQAAKARRPYGIYLHGDSLHPREQHLLWHNTVLPLDDPWWDTHSPSNGYGCKCKKMSASEADLKRYGLSVSASPKVELRDYIDKATGEVKQIPKGIDPGFEYRPGNLAEANQTLKQTLQAKPTAKKSSANKSPVIAPPRMVDSVFSSIRGVEAKGLSQLLDQLPTESKTLLGDYIQQRGAKTLFVKQTEMGRGKAADKIKEEVAAYLGLDPASARYQYYSHNAARTNGFTAKRWGHVVVKAPASANFKKVDMAIVSQAANEVLTAAANGNSYWSVSTRAKALAGDHASVLVTWAHEMGHQIHFWGGETTLAQYGFVSQYGMSTNYETFAEWFACWLFAPAAVKAHNPALYQAIVDTLKQAASSTARKV
jgi:hypothetical protein